MKLNQPKGTSNAQSRAHQPPPPPPRITSNSPPVTNMKKYSDWLKPTHQNADNAERCDELLSNDQLTEMMIELFQGLRASKTRLDQIQAVASVVLKYSISTRHV